MSPEDLAEDDNDDNPMEGDMLEQAGYNTFLSQSKHWEPASIQNTLKVWNGSGSSSECNQLREVLVRICLSNPVCQLSRLQPCISNLCERPTYMELSMRALEELAVVVSVIAMCSILYLGLALVERFFHRMMIKEDASQ